tara:strand:+ start:114 stop:227 length:114 start_codon:yes stop_codon:yes gene_type:complete
VDVNVKIAIVQVAIVVSALNNATATFVLAKTVKSQEK